MKIGNLTMLVVVLLSMLLPLSAVQAQSSITLSVTEADLNSAFRVRNPARTTVSNVVVDVQEGQVVISATVTPQRGNQTPATVAVTYVPSLVNTGSRTRLEWTITSTTVNGKTDTGSTYAAIRNAYSSALRNAVESKLTRSFNITGVTVSGDVITITGTR